MKKVDKSQLNPVLQDDILRYKKNKFASAFALLALVFNCLYFTLFYGVNKQTGFYTLVMGASVIVNLLVLLLGFFASEGIKGYNGKFAIVLFVLAGVQIARIFVFPLMGMTNDWLKGNHYFGIEMTSALQGVILIVYLVASAACFIVAGVQGLITARRLVSFQKKLDNGEVSIDETLKELDEKDAAESTKAKSETEEPGAEGGKEVAPEIKEDAVNTSSEEGNNG